jgi:hypothetical protein
MQTTTIWNQIIFGGKKPLKIGILEIFTLFFAISNQQNIISKIAYFRQPYGANRKLMSSGLFSAARAAENYFGLFSTVWVAHVKHESGVGVGGGTHAREGLHPNTQ